MSRKSRQKHLNGPHVDRYAGKKRQGIPPAKPPTLTADKGNPTGGERTPRQRELDVAALNDMLIEHSSSSHQATP